MANRRIRAGQTLTLLARFKDDLGEGTQASGVYVHIFEPTIDTTDDSLATVVSGVPTYLGEGVFSYDYNIPYAGPEGAWHDKWIGTLNTQALEATLEFDVYTAGAFTALDNQLFVNDLVTVSIPSGIYATDGTYLESEYEFEFMTTTNPSYTNTRKVRLEAGGFLGSVEDDTIQTSILEASIEADVLTFTSIRTNSALYQHARREYVTCLASAMLVNNLGNMQLKGKTLGDLSVQYDTNGIRDMLGKLQECMEKWTGQLLAGGGARARTQPSYVVKGAADPDRPAIGRVWDNRGAHPVANMRAKNQQTRRYLKTYWPRTKKWW